MANYGRDHVAIDVKAMTYSSDTLVDGNFVMSPKCCIFKIPIILSRHNEKAYAPNAFSIGPWNLGKPHLEPTQKIKLKYLQGLVGRSSNPGKQLKQLEDAIREVEEKAREYYAGPVVTQDLFKILVLDGCFIIELFRKDAKIVPKDDDDPIFTMSCMLQFLYHDLILLENQIPWFVLELLFDMTKTLLPKKEMTKTPAESNSLDQLAIEFFGNMFSSEKPSMELLRKTKFPSHDSKHILDLLRNWLILSLEKEEENQGWQPLPSATSLEEAGIKFERLMSNSILDVQFINGVLKIPSLLVQETTETIFRNLISFEQCTPNYTPRITSYAILIDNLINTTKDMEILCKKKIIDNWLNVEDATEFFNKLYNDAYVKEFYYHKLCQDVNEYCERRWPRWRANLMHNYFRTPWAVVGIIVAGLILILTIIGTVCSVIQVKQGKK